MSNAIDHREALISLATAALKAAEADAAESDELIFHPEWRPTPRFQRAEAHQYLSIVINQLSEAGRQLQQDQLHIRPQREVSVRQSAPPPQWHAAPPSLPTYQFEYSAPQPAHPPQWHAPLSSPTYQFEYSAPLPASPPQRPAARSPSPLRSSSPRPPHSPSPSWSPTISLSAFPPQRPVPREPQHAIRPPKSWRDASPPRRPVCRSPPPPQSALCPPRSPSLPQSTSPPRRPASPPRFRSPDPRRSPPRPSRSPSPWRVVSPPQSAYPPRRPTSPPRFRSPEPRLPSPHPLRPPSPWRVVSPPRRPASRSPSPSRSGFPPSRLPRPLWFSPQPRWPAPRLAAATPSPSPPQPRLQEDAVAELLKRNQDVFDEIVNHSFPQALGNGTASLDGFRHYMIQDKLYLETCARLKMTAVAASSNFKDIETFGARNKASIEYVDKLKEICITMLGIPESTIDTAPRSVELDASENFYKGSLVLRHEDALLGYYVALLPCVVSYWRIAERLMNDPSTAKDVVYHPAWTVVDYDPSSVEKYTKFINENIAAKGGVDRWNFIFRIACQLEAKLFNTGLRAPTPFRIIPDGAYFVQIFSLGSVVLAIQNIKGSLQTSLDQLDGDFSRNSRLSVVGMNKTGRDNEKWNVIATKDGYTFKNLGTGLYLGISTELRSENGRSLRAVAEPHHWWINPVQSQSNRGPPLYQIYDSANLRYTLHANIEILDGSGRTDFQYTPIIVRENSKVSCQMWLFAGCDIDQTQFNKRANIQIANILAQYEKKVKDQWVVDEEARGVRDRESVRSTELGGQLQKAQMMDAELEAERTMYMRDNNLLRQELERMRLVNSTVQNKLVEKHANEVKDLRKEMEEAIAKKDDLRKEMKAERTRLRKHMEKCEAEKKRLADDLKSAQKGGGVSCMEEHLQAIQQREEAFRKVREVNEKAGRQRKRLEEAIDALDQLSREKDDISRKLKDLESLKNRVNPYDRQQQQLIQGLIDLAKLPIAAADRRHQELLQFMRAAIS